jgi:hypothetical protein
VFPVGIGQALVSSDTQDKLGREGFAELAASLWPVDCQTCGRPLGSAPPSLCVDDMTVFATASRHHEQHRAPEWNQGIITGPSGAYVTHRERLGMLPTSSGTEPDSLPTMLVNPSLESVFLYPVGGTWRPRLPAEFAAAGMVPLGDQLMLYQPITGATARLTAAAVTITMQQPASAGAYECELPESDAPFYREVSAKRGILLVVTHVVDPSSDNLTRQLWHALQTGRVLCGWVALARSR